METKGLLLDSQQTAGNSPLIEDDVASGPVRHFLLLIAIIVAASAFCLFARAACVDAFTRAESYFSEPAREMLVANQFLIPQYYGLPAFDKPILNYWLIDCAYKCLGVSVFSSRVHSIISGIICLFVVALVSRRLFGDRVAVLATAALGSSNLFLEMAASSMSDMTLSLLEFSGLFLFFLGWQSRDRKRTVFLLMCSFLFGLAFMQKGLPVLVLPGSSIVLYLILFPARIKLSDVLGSVLVFLATIAPWHLAVVRAEGTWPLYYMYVRESVGRFLGETQQYNFGHPAYYMFAAFLSGLMPWSVFLPFVPIGLKSDWQHRKTLPSNRFSILMAIYICVHLVFFTASKSNWGYYNLPTLPAACILIANYTIRYWPSVAQKIKLPLAFLAPAIFFCMVLVSGYSSICTWPAKASANPANCFSRIVATLSPNAQVVSHQDLAGQYFYSDLLVFKTGKLPKFASDQVISDGLTGKGAYCAIIPAKHFAKFPSGVKQSATTLGTAQMKYLNFPGCKLAIETPPGQQVVLILVCNKHALSSN